MLMPTVLERVARRVSALLDREAKFVKHNGSFREKELFGVIERPHYCYGMLRAADQAKFLGLSETTAVEFGVASGGGLLNMAELAEMIGNETGVKIHLFGFDAGEGLPSVSGYKDHAELWRDGDFAMEDRSGLLARIGDRAQLIFGDINETVTELQSKISASNPLGFVSIDVDIYTGAVGALRSLTWAPELYLPGVSLYFDDTNFFYANEWAGELLAIREFNETHEMRKVGPDRSLPGRRPRRDLPWYSAMYVGHILDHSVRNSGLPRQALTIDRHHDFMMTNALY